MQNSILKAVEITEPSKLVFKEFPSRPLKEYEIRIKVACTCVCGSDLKNIKNPVKVPQIPGHEFSGEVIETSFVSQNHFSLGKRVTVFPIMGCMKCSACEENNFRDCPKKKSLGFQLPGSFAEEIIVDERFVIPLQDGISYEQGALLEHLCCGYRLMKEISSKRQSSEPVHIVIIGDGPIALADLQVLKAHSYQNITLIGKHENRKKLAKKLGASRIINFTYFGNRNCDLPPVDICILAADAEEILIHMIPLMMPSSIFYPQTRVKSSTIVEILKKSKISFGRAFAYLLTDFEEMMRLIEAGKINTDLLITTRVSLSEAVEKFNEFYENKNNIKTLIVNENCKSFFEQLSENINDQINIEENTQKDPFFKNGFSK